MLDYSNLSYRIEPMRKQHLDAVMEIERVSFSAPWSMDAFSYELDHNAAAHYVVALPQTHRLAEAIGAVERPLWRKWFEQDVPIDPMVGYGGFWKILDEAHISTIAVAPAHRRIGIGELLLVAMIESSQEIGATVVTLEVRPSNTSAQALYHKYGFKVVGGRTKYYSDNLEDALIMTTPRISTAAYQVRFQELRLALVERLSA